MILELLRVIRVANDLIEKNRLDRALINSLYQDLSSLDQIIEETIDSTNINQTN